MDIRRVRVGAGAQEFLPSIISLEGNYFIDKVSGASIDVLSQASVNQG